MATSFFPTLFRLGAGPASNDSNPVSCSSRCLLAPALPPCRAVSYSVPCSLNDDRRHHGSNFFKSRLRPATLQRSTSAADPAIIISSSSAVDVERSDEEMAVAVAI